MLEDDDDDTGDDGGGDDKDGGDDDGVGMVVVMGMIVVVVMRMVVMMASACPTCPSFILPAWLPPSKQAPRRIPRGPQLAGAGCPASLQGAQLRRPSARVTRTWERWEGVSEGEA